MKIIMTIAWVLLPEALFLAVFTSGKLVNWDDGLEVEMKRSIEIDIRKSVYGKIRTWWRVFTYGNDWDTVEDIEQRQKENGDNTAQIH